jgi:hypothetical protein
VFDELVLPIGHKIRPSLENARRNMILQVGYGQLRSAGGRLSVGDVDGLVGK